ncbi:MAG: OFA family MFS transporter [Chthonomonadales bacterium]|nr:OFA family MFS transporter [Chthonomonadales bacterium]
MTSEATASAPSSTARWRVLVGAIVVQLILGTVYGYSIFWQPLEQKLYPQDFISESEQAKLIESGKSVPTGVQILPDAEAKKRHDERQAPLKYAFAIAILSFALFMVYAGRVQDVKGPRLPAMIGGLLIGVAFLVEGLVLQLGLIQGIGANTVVLILTIGLIAGAGIGFAYVCPIAALVKWFPTAKGLVSGIAVAGFGFGAFIYSNKDLPFGGSVFLREHGVGPFFLAHGAISLIAVLIGAALLSNPPGTPPKAPAESEAGELLRKPGFYMLWAMFFSGALAGLTVIGVAKGFAGEQLVMAAGAVGPDAKKELMEKGALAVGSLAIFNAIGRVVWGVISDRIGRTPTFVAMFALQAAMMFILPSLTTETAIAFGAGMVGFNFGGNFALFPSATADLFGAKSLGANYGLVFTSYGVAGVAGIFAANTAKDLTGSYAGAFAICGVLCVLSCAVAIALHIWRARAVPATA